MINREKLRKAIIKNIISFGYGNTEFHTRHIEALLEWIKELENVLSIISDDKQLELGIEIVSAMKASCYNYDIEEGRIIALEGTEIDNMEGVTPEMWDNFTDVNKERYTVICLAEKEILHKQAMFVAKIATEKLYEMANK